MRHFLSKHELSNCLLPPFIQISLLQTGEKKKTSPQQTLIIVSKVVLKTVSETFKSQCNHFGNRKLKRAWWIRVLLTQITSSNLSQIPPEHFLYGKDRFPYLVVAKIS